MRGIIVDQLHRIGSWQVVSDSTTMGSVYDSADSAVAVVMNEWFGAHPILGPVAALALIVVVAWLAFAFVKRYLLRVIHTITRRTQVWWDEILISPGLAERLAWFVPLVIVHLTTPFVPHLPADLLTLIQRLTLSTLVLFGVRAVATLLGGVNEVYGRLPVAKDRPIKGILQVLNIILHLSAAIVIIAILMDRSPWLLFSGLGAMTAILLLVFRDTLLSLVAGVQLTANDLIRVGDWIDMPQFNADGEVIDIALNAVRVQNWDRTITVIPTHKFLENSFKNWRGMRESGGRRIKRSVYIDMRAIRFLTEEEIERFGRFALLRDYIAQKRKELEEHNRIHAAEPGIIANARRLTNIGTLRAYIVNYLRQHPGVHQGMTLMVRQLQPTAEGLPLEIYVFTNDTAWVVYEGIQSDIFDHVLAMIPEFGLRVFQNPSGHDLSEIKVGVPLQPA